MPNSTLSSHRDISPGTIMHGFVRALVLGLVCVGGAAASEIEVVARLTEAPGNVTVTPDGRIIMSLHEFYSPTRRVVELKSGGRLVAFPNDTWNAAQESEPYLDSVLGIQSDTKGVVWMLDNGRRGKVTPKLVGWDSRNDTLVRIIDLPAPATSENSFVNDLAIDEQHNAIYIADPAGGDNAALIVVDLNTGQARRVLQGDQSVIPENIYLIIDNRSVKLKREDGTFLRPRVGVNPIALDAKAEWLYFGPMHGKSMYRIRTQDLLNRELENDALAQKVERYSDKPICDGISIDRAGNIYISDIANNAVGVISTLRRYEIIAEDRERLSWPDAFSFGPDGKLYTVANQLHRTAVLNAGVMAAKPPYYVLQLEPMAPGIPGR